MKHTKSIIGLTFISTFLLSGILLLVLGYLWFQSEKRSLKEGYTSFKVEHIAAQKQIIRNEVQHVIDFITYSQSLTEERIQDDLRARVNEAHALATHLYMKYKDSLNAKEIQEIIKEALRPVRFNNGRGYYFITSLTGKEILFADRPELEGTNVMNLRDTTGKWVIKDMISLVRNYGEGFYTYNWSKPRHIGKDFQKTAYVKYFKPLNWLIGTGEYVDETENAIRKETLKRIGDIRFGNDGYIFILTADGTMISHINPEYVGQNLMNFQDPTGIQVIEKILAAANNKEGAFIQYQWEKPSLGRTASKLSYARKYDKWDWVIGAGIYLDDMEAALQTAQDRFNKRAASEFTVMGFLFCLLLMILLSISLFFSKRIARGLKTFDDFFARAVTHHQKIDEKDLPFEEFKILAARANVMVDDMASARQALASLNQNLEKQVLERTAELEKANQELVELDKLKSSFITTVSHELRTPLTSIVGFTKLIGRDVKRHMCPAVEADDNLRQKTERILDNLSIMEGEGDRLTRMVSDILDLSKIESGKMEWRNEIVHIGDCVGMAANSLSGQLESKPDIALERHIEPELPPIEGDSDKVTQVIINLAGNAIKFMTEGTIRIEASAINDGVQILVRDEGPGIAPEDQKIIFDKFRQAHDGTATGKPSGTGLGLAISRHIVEHFNGHIWVESELGKGSCFGFFLPVKQ
jgi:signal transduction histidine kinase